MTWMNEWDVEKAYESSAHRDDVPVLAAAAETLYGLMRWTNQNSDGWAYWNKPAKAAEKLQALIDPVVGWNGHIDHDLTAAEVKKAYSPIKSFLARQIREGRYVDPSIVVPVPA